LKRRTFIRRLAQASIIAATATKLPLFAKSGKQNPLALNDLRIPPVISGGDITIAPATFKIFPNIDTNILSINNSFPAPTIKLKKGDTFSAKVINNLTEPSVVHWHGIHVPALMDGHPKNAIAPGSSFDVSYPIIQRAGTYFYHSHADMNTAKQSYMGMLGMFIIEDDEELALGLPTGEFDIPLLIQDKRFDANKQLLYAPAASDMSSGWLGDTILINGTPSANLNVGQTMYRFRLVNGSNARIYNIALSNGKQFLVIGNDGGLLEKPVSIASAMFSPAERLDIIIDFSGNTIGDIIMLKSLAFSYNGDPGFPTLPQGSAVDLLQFTVDHTAAKGNPIPASLSAITQYNAADAKRIRTFELNGDGFINLLSFNMNRIDEHVPFGDLEQWSFINESQDTHPMHSHGTQFQVLDRSGSPPEVYETGWKDVIRVDPSQTVNVLIRFADYTGVYLVHCHNMEHEDMGMMSNFQVESSGFVEEKTQQANSITVIPNPANDHTILNFPTLQNDTILLITDEKGTVVLRDILGKGLDVYGVATGHLSQGSYFVSLNNLYAKILVMH
jgi:FtsP/CotA-like multicopper oxidase with cupredoxin domain